MIEKFLEHLAVERRYSVHTLSAYRRDLRDFEEFLAQKGLGNLQQAGTKQVREFVVEMSRKDLHKRSINRKLSSLRSFYLFLLKLGEIKISPMLEVSSLRFHAERQIPISEDEMDQLKCVLKEGVDEDAFLFYVVVELFYQTGIRRAELCHLKVGDLDFSRREIKVLGKANKRRLVPISENLLSLLQAYLDRRRERVILSSEDYLFVSSKGKKLSEKLVYSRVKAYLGLVSGKRKRSPHILRHSFATHLLDHGASIMVLKRILGHSSISSTQIYAGVGLEQLKRAFNQAHPRAKNADQYEN